jgi:hypothetical protein
MSVRTRWLLVVLAGVVSIVTAVGITVWIVDSGAAARAARVTSVRPGTSSPGTTFTAYHYRTSSRFGGQVAVSVSDGTVYVTGPRLDRTSYYGFIGLLMLTWAAIPPLLAAAVLFRRWRLLWWLPAIFVINLVAGALGAATLWEIADMASIEAPGGLTRVSFPVSAVRDVKVGPGWSREGLALAIWPFVPAIDQVAKTHAVSFQAPGGESGRTVVYAMHFYTPADAERFVKLLSAR